MHRKITHAILENKSGYFKFSVALLPDSFEVFVCFNEDFFYFARGNSFTKEIIALQACIFYFCKCD